MGAIGRAFVLSFTLLAGFDLPAAANCPCPKSKMIEVNGTVSMLPPPLPGPRRAQPMHALGKPIVSATALLSMADVTTTMPTPLVDLLGIDRLANPLSWTPIFAK